MKNKRRTISAQQKDMRFVVDAANYEWVVGNYSADIRHRAVEALERINARSLLASRKTR